MDRNTEQIVGRVPRFNTHPINDRETEDDIQEKDIELIMSQTGSNRGTALTALRKHNGDIVNSIIEINT